MCLAQSRQSVQSFAETAINLTNVLKVRSGEFNVFGDKFVTAFVNYENQEPRRITTFTLFPNDFLDRGSTFELSPQIGCRFNCPFCGVPGFSRNLEVSEVVEQVAILVQQAQKVGAQIRPPFKFSFTDGGELLLNPDCMQIIGKLTEVLPAYLKVSTVLPDSELVRENLDSLISFNQLYSNIIHLQISMVSTSQDIRQQYGRQALMNDWKIRKVAEEWLEQTGRKPTLAFTLTTTSHCRVEEIVQVLSPDLFMVKLSPYKPNLVPGNETISLPNLDDLVEEFQQAGYELIPTQLNEVERKIGLLLSGTRSFEA